MVNAMYDNRSYFFDVEAFDNGTLVKEGYYGFRAVEKEENLDTVFIYFKDFKYSDVVERFFKVKKEIVPEVRDLYEHFSHHPYEKFQKLIALKKDVLDKHSAEKVFENNMAFFIAINLSLNEWYGFNELIEKRVY